MLRNPPRVPRFSIIIPIYKSARFFPWTVASLREQEFHDWEAILVDDGSDNEEVTARMREAEDSDPRIRTAALVPNQGVSAARNRGLEMATGDYLIFLDSDDLLLPWTLATIDSVIRQENNPAFLIGNSVLVGPDDPVAMAEPAGTSVEIYQDYLDYRARVKFWWFNPSGAIMRADAVRSINGFWGSRELCEDIDLWQRLGTEPRFTRITSPVTYGYRLHDGGAHHGFLTLYKGLNLMVRAEKDGIYPGGKSRSRDRIEVITNHARHHALEFAASSPDLAWKIYIHTLLWNIRLRRWKFLSGFPVVALFRMLPSRVGTSK